MNGGYILVDFNGYMLGEEQTIPGIYNKVKKAIDSGKLIILTNVKRTIDEEGEVIISPMPCTGYYQPSGNGDIAITRPNLNVNITPQDVIE